MVEPVPRAPAAFSPAAAFTSGSDTGHAASHSDPAQATEKGLFLPLTSGLSMFTTYLPLNFCPSLLRSCRLGRAPPGCLLESPSPGQRHGRGLGRRLLFYFYPHTLISISTRISSSAPQKVFSFHFKQTQLFLGDVPNVGTQK